MNLQKSLRWWSLLRTPHCSAGRDLSGKGEICRESYMISVNKPRRKKRPRHMHKWYKPTASNLRVWQLQPWSDTLRLLLVFSQEFLVLSKAFALRDRQAFWVLYQGIATGSLQNRFLRCDQTHIGCPWRCGCRVCNIAQFMHVEHARRTR